MSSSPSVSEPVSALRAIPIRENGDPLVNFAEVYPELKLASARFDYRRETYLRSEVARRVAQADRFAAQRGFRILIHEGWRAPFIQKRMYAYACQKARETFPDKSDLAIRRFANRFTAPMNKRVPPPHTTGGAVDVTLTDLELRPVDVCSPFPSESYESFPTEVKGLSRKAQENRRLLVEAMSSSLLTNYPSEYWHWSFGDQGWAYRGGHPNAFYDSVEPAGWSPDPRDVLDLPLERA